MTLTIHSGSKYCNYAVIQGCKNYQCSTQAPFTELDGAWVVSFCLASENKLLNANNRYVKLKAYSRARYPCLTGDNNRVLEMVFKILIQKQNTVFYQRLWVIFFTESQRFFLLILWNVHGMLDSYGYIMSIGTLHTQLVKIKGANTNKICNYLVGSTYKV